MGRLGDIKDFERRTFVGVLRVTHPPHGVPGQIPLRQARTLWGPLRGVRMYYREFEQPGMILGNYERRLVATIRSHVRRGSVAYDVGANIGYLTLVLDRFVGAGGTV